MTPTMLRRLLPAAFLGSPNWHGITGNRHPIGGELEPNSYRIRRMTMTKFRLFTLHSDLLFLFALLSSSEELRGNADGE